MKWTLQNIGFGLLVLLVWFAIRYTHVNSGHGESSMWIYEYLSYAIPGCVPLGFFVINYRHARLVMYSILVTAIHTSVWYAIFVACLANPGSRF